MKPVRPIDPFRRPLEQSGKRILTIYIALSAFIVGQASAQEYVHTIPPWEFTHDPALPVVEPHTYVAPEDGLGQLTGLPQTAAQSTQDLFASLDFIPNGFHLTKVNCMFFDYSNDKNDPAQSDQELWWVDASAVGVMAGPSYDAANPASSVGGQMTPVYKTCSDPSVHVAENCGGPKTDTSNTDSLFNWDAWLPGPLLMEIEGVEDPAFWLHLPVKSICVPGTACLGGLFFDGCRVFYNKNTPTTPCSGNDCDINALCSPYFLEYTCECLPGYSGDGYTCLETDEAVDECAEGTDDCDALALCEDIPESYTCTCPAGYNGDGSVCLDIDECGGAIDDCDPLAACENVAGSFTCTCPELTIDVNGDGTLCEAAVDPSPTEQTIELLAGWNIISTYIDTADYADFVAVLLGIEGVESASDLSTYVTIAKNNLGAAYLPEWGFNGIGDWLVGQGYQLKVTEDVSLVVEGELLAPEDHPIVLAAGWNLIGYLRVEPADTIAVFADLVDTITIVKNNAGGAYLTEWSFNGIGDMQPGEGYQVKTVAEATLVYNANGDDYE